MYITYPRARNLSG